MVLRCLRRGGPCCLSAVCGACAALSAAVLQGEAAAVPDAEHGLGCADPAGHPRRHLRLRVSGRPAPRRWRLPLGGRRGAGCGSGRACRWRGPRPCQTPECQSPAPLGSRQLPAQRAGPRADGAPVSSSSGGCGHTEGHRRPSFPQVRRRAHLRLRGRCPGGGLLPLRPGQQGEVPQGSGFRAEPTSVLWRPQLGA